jgi:hypothetical protein
MGPRLLSRTSYRVANMKRRWKILIGVAASVLIVGGGSSLLISRAVDQTYSADWRSSSSSDAARRGVLISSPVIMPAVASASDAVDLRVTDAWVERPTHVEYRWLFMRREVKDSAYRLVVHLTKVPRGDSAWTDLSRRCFAFVDFYLNEKRVGSSGDFAHEELFYQSSTPIPDTVRLRIVRHGHMDPPPGAPPSGVPDCP